MCSGVMPKRSVVLTLSCGFSSEVMSVWKRSRLSVLQAKRSCSSVADRTVQATWGGQYRIS